MLTSVSCKHWKREVSRHVAVEPSPVADPLALRPPGIPIDMIGGTSIGSLIGGLYAKEGEVVSSYGRAKKFSGRMGSLWRFASDLTYPVVSYTTGHESNRGIFKALGSTPNNGYGFGAGLGECDCYGSADSCAPAGDDDVLACC